MANIKTQTLKGFRDFLPEKAKKRAWLISTLKEVFESYGFEPLKTPALEYEEVLLGKYGEEGDRLMYRFEDNGKRKVALRYDQTVPLARVVAQYQNELPMPFKRYQIQNVWRAENTQKGRYREFVQCDIDTVGSSSPLADAEIIVLAAKSLEKLGFTNFKILINDRKIFEGIDSKTIGIIDKLEKIGEEEVKKLLRELGSDESVLDEIRGQSKTESINLIEKYLREMGISDEKIVFKPTLARGLDYYTGLIFEIEIEGYDAGSVAGGGRYDNLIGMFAGRQVPAVGFAFGFDRLMEALEQFDLFPKDLNKVKVLVTISSPDLVNDLIKICETLSDEGIPQELYLNENATLEKQLKYADKKKIPYSLIVTKEKFSLKNMEKREQEDLSLEEIVKRLK